MSGESPNWKYLAKKFGEWIDFDHEDIIYKIKFGWLKFGEPRTICQIRQTFPPPNIPALQYIMHMCTLF